MSDSIIKGRFFFLLLTLLFIGGCDANSPSNQYQLAEKLFLEGKYSAAIHEFGKIVEKEPNSRLGIDSLYRIGTIQRLYLNDSKSAISSFQLLLTRTDDPELNQKARDTLGEMFFTEFSDYERAIPMYKSLVSDKIVNPLKRDFYKYRLGRSLFFMAQFDEAYAVFTDLEISNPDGDFSERAVLAQGDTLNASGKCQEAIVKYETLQKTPDHKVRSLAVFGMANCYEELDNLDKAYDLLDSIKDSYSTPHVIELKMKKIKRRKILRRR